MSRKHPEYPNVPDSLGSRAARRFVGGNGIVVATCVVIAGAFGVVLADSMSEEGVKDDRRHESPAKDQPEEQPGAGSPEDIADPRTVDALLAFLIDEGDYPEGLSTVAVAMPPNGPDEVTAAMEQVQDTNSGRVPSVDSSKVDAVTSCGAAETWRREGDWNKVTDQLREDEFDQANLTCAGIIRNVASEAPPSGTSYINFPELLPK